MTNLEKQIFNLVTAFFEPPELSEDEYENIVSTRNFDDIFENGRNHGYEEGRFNVANIIKKMIESNNKILK